MLTGLVADKYARTSMESVRLKSWVEFRRFVAKDRERWTVPTYWLSLETTGNPMLVIYTVQFNSSPTGGITLW